ncbi:MAG: adenylate/guanylate cyclase domain-containing protein [Nitrososphaerales archaeon]
MGRNGKSKLYGKGSHTETDLKYGRSELDRKVICIPEEDHLTSTNNRNDLFLASLEGKTIDITAVSIDIVDSSTKVQTLSNEDAGAYYQTFIENTSDLIQECGGYVLKNVGDCVIGFFPCSKYYTENHDKAVLCGLTLRDMIKDSLGPYFISRKLPSIACRVSADYGAAAVIRIRSNGDYSAIDLFGGAMNSVARILHNAMPNQMVIGDSLFWRLPREDFDFKIVNRWDLSGKWSYPVYVVERRKHANGGSEYE